MSKNLFSYVQGRRFQNHSTNKEILRKKDFIFYQKIKSMFLCRSKAFRIKNIFMLIKKKNTLWIIQRNNHFHATHLPKFTL
jgi:spore coat polysaccharide biosynthesis protein SpsF (cytidylyltransferase family)